MTVPLLRQASSFFSSAEYATCLQPARRRHYTLDLHRFHADADARFGFFSIAFRLSSSFLRFISFHYISLRAFRFFADFNISCAFICHRRLMPLAAMPCAAMLIRAKPRVILP
jgi:hypothetical protein